MAAWMSVRRLECMKAIAAEPLADEELVRQLTQGRSEALAALHARYQPRLMRLASRHVGPPAAEDIIQEVFLTVWQHAHSFDSSRGTFRAWVVQIARRRTFNELRRRQSRPQLERDPHGELLGALPDEVPDMAEHLAAVERRTAVLTALGLLPQSHREAVQLAFLDDLTHSEVARALHAPLGTTKTRIRTGLQKLRAELLSLQVVC
jgi:RNA polymerase sigma-70 factor (ECF subfamily)